MTYLVKLPSILADLGIAYLIYSYFKNKKMIRQSYLIPSLWLFNPVTLYNSSIWGQTDSLVNLLGLLSVIFLLRKNLVGSAIFLTLSILFKGSLMIFIPVLFIVALKQKYELKRWFKAVSLSLIVVLIVSISFHPKVDMFLWLYNLYTQRFFPGEIGSLSANAFNFWWIIDSGKTLDSTLFFGLTARVWGYILTISSLSFIFWWFKDRFSEKRIWFSLVLSSFTTFLFLTRIHERYLFPIFPSFTILIGFMPELLFTYSVLSILHLLNLYHLFWAPSIPFLENAYLNPELSFLLAVSHILVFTSLFTLYAKKDELTKTS